MIGSRKRGTNLLITVFSLLLGGVACSGGSRADLHKTLQAQWTQAAPDQQPMLLAAYQPWFGRPNHINVGYSSLDRVVLEKQVDEAKQLGIRGFVVNWYGARDQFEDKSYALLQQIAADKDFKTAIMYDEDDRNPGGPTDAVLVDLQYAYDRYISPHATVPRNSYLRFNGRPVIFIFPKARGTDWNKVRRMTQSWEDPPLLIYEDINEKFAKAFDGFFAWVHPGKQGWTHDGSNWGQAYLENFYTTMNNKYPDKIAIGAAWPGFNDSKASWSRNRKMDARCGRTFEDSLRVFRRYYNQEHPLPFLMIVTWNDYEEGTAIERGYANCGGKKAEGPFNTFAEQ
jgi:hypothetical protein